MNQPGYRLVAVELNDLVPRRNQSFPNLFVTLTRAKVLDHDEAVHRIRKKGHYARHIVRGRPELVPDVYFSERKDGKARANAVRQALAHQGFTVNPSITSEYRLYVIDLDPERLKNPGSKNVYVGETSIDIEDRLKQHVRGFKAARVAKAMTTLNMNLTPTDKILHSEWDAIAEEEALASALIAKGYSVWGPNCNGCY